MSDETEWTVEKQGHLWDVVEWNGDQAVRVITVGLDKPTAHRIAAVNEFRDAAQKQEDAELANANCPECDGQGVPELCERCFPLFDDARLMRRSALAKARGEQ